MFFAWRRRDRAGRTAPRGTAPRPHSRWRPQVEMLEDRLAPSSTLPAALATPAPSGVPVVGAVQQQASAPALLGVLRLDAASAGLNGAQRVALVFQLAGNSSVPPALEVFDPAGQTWKPVQGSTQMTGSLSVNTVRGTITLILDASSVP